MKTQTQTSNSDIALTPKQVRGLKALTTDYLSVDGDVADSLKELGLCAPCTKKGLEWCTEVTNEGREWLKYSSIKKESPCND